MSWDRVTVAVRVALLICGLAPGAACTRAVASERPPPTLNPKTYASPSGRYALRVNPSDLYGRGKASYTLSVDGKPAWSAEKPYALWDARVTDEGVVAGYAYAHGLRGFSGVPNAGPGDFRVVILDSRGTERLNQATPREESRFLHTPPNPLVAGLILDEAHDRVIVRVADADVNRQAESWWPYTLSTGKPMAKLRPKELMADPEPARYLIDARPVAGSPLLILAWYCYQKTMGARFTLVGQDGKPVWSRDLPDDYHAGGDDNAQERIMESVRRTGPILESTQPGRFALWFVKDAQRVSFAVAPSPAGAWTVTELDRRPFVEPTTPKPSPASIPVLSLERLGQVVLRGPSMGSEPEVRRVSEFVIDGDGRIAFLRSSDDGMQSLVVVNQQGTVLCAIPLDAARGGDTPAAWSNLTCLGPKRYLIIRDVPGDRTKMEALLVDVAAGTARPFPGFKAAPGAAVAGFSDGGFVVEGGLEYVRYTSEHGLHAFDGTGKRLWTSGKGRHNDPGALFSPADLAVTTDGMIAVVDTIRNTVQFFDRSGKFRRAIDLEKAWGRKPTYPSGISADRDGGVIIEDFQGNPPIVRMSADGTVRAQVRPRLEDGRTFRLANVQAAPDGALWVSDGHALYRLKESGVVDRVLGQAPDPRAFAEVDAVALDGKGRIYAAVGRTGAVHVFDPDGQWLRVCTPDPRDVPEELMLPHLNVSDAGEVYLGLDHFAESGYLHFSADGKRVGIEACRLDDSSETWYAQPGTKRRWVLGYEKLFLIDEAGVKIRTIERRADGEWLEHPERASTAPDGSIAVASAKRNERGDPRAVTLYSPDGEPRSTFTLPPAVEWFQPRIAYDGKRVVVVDEAIVIFDASGKVLGRVKRPSEVKDAWLTPLLHPGGRELLLFDGRKTLHRFALP